jgi:hypothetical protein
LFLSALLFIAYKVLKYPGSIGCHDALLCSAFVLSMGLVGGLIGLALGKVFCSSDRDN